MINFDYAANVPKHKFYSKLLDFSLNSFNPNSNHKIGKETKKYINFAKSIILKLFSCYDQIEFIPGGGTLSNNRAIIGSIPFSPKVSFDNKIDTILISSQEHLSINKLILDKLIIQGYNVIKIPCNNKGIIDLKILAQTVQNNKYKIALVSLIYVNNETGIIQPIIEAVKLIKEINATIIVHSDICQGVPLFFEKIGTSSNYEYFPDLITLSCYKFGGPYLGIVLYKKNIKLNFEYFGTPDAASIYLSSLILEDILKENKKCLNQTLIIKNLLKEKLNLILEKYCNQYIILSEDEISVPFIFSFLLPGYETRIIQNLLSNKNILIGTGSACSSQSKKGSHVIKALGYDNEFAFCLIRLSFSPKEFEYIDKLIFEIDLVLKELSFVKNQNKIIKNNKKQAELFKSKFDKSNIFFLPINKFDESMSYQYNAILISVGELFLKKGNQKYFRNLLLSNIKSKLDKNISIINKYNKFILVCENFSQIESQINLLKKIPGISKICPIYYFKNNNNDYTCTEINKILVNIFKENIGNNILNFKINTKLINTNNFLEMDSLSCNYSFGNYINRYFEQKVKVNLNSFDICINIDIYNDIICEYNIIYKGLLGLPLGSEGEIICLVDESNYYLSLISSYLMMCRGAKIILIIIKTSNIYQEFIDILKQFDNTLTIEYIDQNGVIQHIINKISSNKQITGIIFEVKSIVNMEVYIVLKKLEQEIGMIIINNTMLMGENEINNRLYQLAFEIKTFNEQFNYYDELKKRYEIKVYNNRILSLLSGGIDSPVASKILIEKGFHIDFIHFTTNLDKIDSILEIKKIISTSNNKLFVVNFLELQKEIVKICKENYRTIMYKIFMIIIANKIALENNYSAISTGDSWGQVASQTPNNLIVSRNLSNLPILSPLLCNNKNEIIKIAEHIGTYESSICDGTNDCCKMYLPKHPILCANINLIKNYIGKINKSFIENLIIQTLY